MKIFVDENIPSRTVEELRGLGHDVLDIRGTATEFARTPYRPKSSASDRVRLTTAPFEAS